MDLLLEAAYSMWSASIVTSFNTGRTLGSGVFCAVGVEAV
jgi:hypothetical protein